MIYICTFIEEIPRPQTAAAVFDTKHETEEILNSILPPRCWEEDGQLWTQTVSLVLENLKFSEI